MKIIVDVVWYYPYTILYISLNPVYLGHFIVTTIIIPIRCQITNTRFFNWSRFLHNSSSSLRRTSVWFICSVRIITLKYINNKQLSQDLLKKLVNHFNKTSETIFVKNECFITPFLLTHTLNVFTLFISMSRPSFSESARLSTGATSFTTEAIDGLSVWEEPGCGLLAVLELSP